MGTQRNFRLELVAGSWALWLGCRFALSPNQWALLFLTVGMVLAMELLNTGLEAAVDLFGPRRHPLAKLAKDAAAGGVLLAALSSLGVGAALFWDPPRLCALWSGLLAQPLCLLLLVCLAAVELYYVFFHPLSPR